jgi:hypothetical protein
VTKRWNVRVGVYPDRKAFLNDQPVKMVEIPIETEHRHRAMAEAEEEVRETITGLENGHFEVWAVDAEELH